MHSWTTSSRSVFERLCANVEVRAGEYQYDIMIVDWNRKATTNLHKKLIAIS